jgi:hypothetical protein
MMDLKKYESPELVRAGNVRNLTLGGQGPGIDNGGAGSITVTGGTFD